MHNSPFSRLGVVQKLFFMLKHNTFHNFFPTACNSGGAGDYDNINSVNLQKNFRKTGDSCRFSIIVD
jgi:hypothetical protein